MHLQINNLLDISNIIIPFFDIYSISGIKLEDYYDWKRVYLLMKNKEHLTLDGKIFIEKIRLNMNKNRKWD